jgi:Mrp family chromosome partitioning ATPase
MSQAEIVKSPIINVVWSATEAGQAPAQSNGNGNGHGPSPRRPSTTQRIGSPPIEAIAPRPVEAITTFAWTNTPVALIEEVELSRELDPRLVMLRAPGSAQARSYRLLQHRLFAKADPRVIAVTSAEPGEGKTTCAANLALALSEAALSRVLLVDANLVRPGLADLFGFEPADSFMGKLLRSEDAAPPFNVASVGGIGLQLAAVPASVARGKRLDRLLFSEALRALRSAYDYIVIDTASVLESADVNSVSQCADGVVIAARAGKSKKSSHSRAIRQLEPALVVGSVLLDV